jgi:hypothetical protein
LLRGVIFALGVLAGKDRYMSNVDYIQQRKNRKHHYLRLRLGILQMIHKPMLDFALSSYYCRSSLFVDEKGYSFFIV